MLLGCPLGVMQGRLLPKYGGRYQAHPKGYWADEFPIVAAMGLELVEFIFDYEDAGENPLLAPGGIEAIRSVCARTGVGVRTICADYFMAAPLHRPETAKAASEALARLLNNVATLGITDVVIPCVDQSRLADDGDADRLLAALDHALPAAERFGINLALETDLPPDRFATFLARIPSPRVTVNYDIGNSASLGFDPREEFAAYGSRISDIHIKDRARGGGSVLLGDGVADLRCIAGLIRESGFRGPLILQAYRDDEGKAILGRQISWIRDLWRPHEA